MGPVSGWPAESAATIAAGLVFATRTDRAWDEATMNFQEPIGGLIERIARALERLAPLPPRKPDFDRAEGFIWQAVPEAFLPVIDVNRVPLSLLKGIDRMRHVLLDNTSRFARGFPPTTRCFGARGGWARALSSRRSMPKSAVW